MPAPALKQVQFSFKSGSRPMDTISKQYGASAATYPNGNTVSVLVATASPYGGTIAKWELRNGLWLRLFVTGYEGKDYVLILSNRKIESADDQAKRRTDKEKEEKYRAANPPPKF